MARPMQRRSTLRRKLHILRSISASKPVGESSAVSVALLRYIQKLKIKLAALARDYYTLHETHRQLLNFASLLKNDVRVEKVGNAAWQLFVVRVRCERRGGRLVSILEAFEKMGLEVMQARVSCDRLFCMDAVVVEPGRAQNLEARNVARVLIDAIDQQKEQEEEEDEKK